MATTRGTMWRRNSLLGACVAAACGLVVLGTARAQSLDMDVSPAAPPAATHQSGELDMDVDPTAPITAPPVAAPPVAKPPVQALSPGANVQDGIILAKPAASAGQTATPTLAPGATVQDGIDLAKPATSADQSATPAQPPATVQTATTGPTTSPGQPPLPLSTLTPSQPPDNGQPSTTAAPAPPPPISLDHPTVIDTARLKAGDTTVTLFGINGIQGEEAQSLQSYLASTDDHLMCETQPTTDFVCLLADGTDVAQAALLNGAARAKAEAPEAYHDQEAAAQAARRGIWSTLPPPPATVAHPVVRDTATLMADSQTYVLDGLQGLGAPYAGQMQSYIAANGDSLSCSPQDTPGHYICVLGDGTDIAKVALVNGAAVVAQDAPDAYRIQQGEALDAHRGIWVNPPPNLLIGSAPAAGAVVFVMVAGDDGTDGITYVGGVPEAVIDGDPVFLVYGGDAGWGYYDHYHHWRDAPGRYRDHMERFHAGGHGLRGYRDEASIRRDDVHPEGVHPDGVHPGAHPGNMRTAGLAGHPGMGPAGHAGEAPGAGRLVAPGVRPGMAGGFHPGVGNAGFARPGPSMGGFHPGGMESHASAPAVHASSGGGGGKHK